MPMGPYKDFDECLAKNKDKADPKAYCGKIYHETEGKKRAGDGTAKSKRTRMLNVSINEPSRFLSNDSGGFTVKDVPVLAEGVWTDSNVGSPLYYPPKILERDAGNWKASGVWSRHSGGAPRKITDKIGNIVDPRYGSNAVIADIYLHGRTQESRDAIELIKNGIITDVSVEHGGKEVWNAETKRYEAASLAFYGLALVDRGACEVCKMKRNEADESECEQDNKESEQHMVETKDLEKKLADLETEKAELSKKFESEKAELSKQLEAASKSKAEGESALKASVDELTKKLAEAEAKIKELGKAPENPRTIANDATRVVELSIVEAVVNRAGELSR